MRLPDIRPGVYRHFKGGLYRVYGVAQHVDTGQPFVVYAPVRASGRLTLRDAAEFAGSVTRDGVTAPRFVLVEERPPLEVEVTGGG